MGDVIERVGIRHEQMKRQKSQAAELRIVETCEVARSAPPEAPLHLHANRRAVCLERVSSAALNPRAVVTYVSGAIDAEIVEIRRWVVAVEARSGILRAVTRALVVHNDVIATWARAVVGHLTPPSG